MCLCVQCAPGAPYDNGTWCSFLLFRAEINYTCSLRREHETKQEILHGRNLVAGANFWLFLASTRAPAAVDTCIARMKRIPLFSALCRRRIKWNQHEMLAENLPSHVRPFVHCTLTALSSKCHTKKREPRNIFPLRRRMSNAFYAYRPHSLFGQSMAK